MKNNSVTSIVGLGGLGEVGKNMYVLNHEDEIIIIIIIIIIDAGVMFPEDDLLGIDYVIQDITYLKKNEEKIKALVITHGHEDHIGGIAYLLSAVNVPVIHSPRIAIDLMRKKLDEKNIAYKNFEQISEHSNVKTKYFDISFIPTTHSIPDSFSLLIKTPNGNIFETGDFKFDLTPVGVDKNGYIKYTSNSKDCSKCPFKEQCCKTKNIVILRHIWESYKELVVNEYRHELDVVDVYKSRSQHVERVFADAKMKHGLRNTLFKGKRRVSSEIGLVFASMNLKNMQNISKLQRKNTLNH